MAFIFRKIIFLSLLAVASSGLSTQIPEGIAIYDSEILQGLEEFIKPALEILEKRRKRKTNIEIFLIHENTANAFATPEQFLCILTGLLTNLQSAEELIGILMHELGHIQGQHSAITAAVLERSQHQVLGCLAGGAILSALTGNFSLLAMANAIGSSLGHNSFTAFSRGQESMADQFAFQMLEQLNWPVDGMIHFFEKFKHIDLSVQKRFPNYFLTHPYFEARAESAKNQKIYRKHKQPPSLPESFNNIFQKMKVKVICIVKNPSFAEEFLKHNKCPEHLKTYGRIFLNLRQGKLNESLALSEQLEKTHPSEFLNEVRSEIFTIQKKFEKALTEIQKACQKQPQNIFFFLKRAEIQLHLQKDLAKLAKELEVSTDIKRLRHSDLESWRWDLLGKAYHQLGNMGRMRICLAEKFFQTKDVSPESAETARMHAEEALKLLPTSDLKFRKKAEEILKQLALLSNRFSSATE
jgi:predicted Zn-dependent protease